MNVFIDNKSGAPIYDQIYTQIKEQIINGTLQEDDPLPSIRNLAKDLRISVVTTKRAYDELEKEGFIYTIAAKGCFVAAKNVELLRETNLKKIEEYKAILADKKLLLGVIKKEILVIAEKYGDDRRTKIGFDEFDISMEDLIPRENVVITMTKLGYIKRMSMDTFKSQNRGGKGIKGMQTLEDDYIRELFITTSHHYIMFFTNTGRVYRLKAYEIPEAGRTARNSNH